MGIALRKIVEDQVPEEAIRRMSMEQEYIDDREWLEALRKAVKDEEDLQEKRKLKGNSFGTVAQKRKAPEQATATAKKPKYTAKEKRVYQAAKMETAKARKETAAPRRKIIHRVWKTAHEGIDQKEIDERKAKGQCTWCTLNNQGWKHCEKEIRISAARATSNPPRKSGRRYNIPVGKRKPRVAAAAEDSQKESSYRMSQRPQAWTFPEDGGL